MRKKIIKIVIPSLIIVILIAVLIPSFLLYFFLSWSIEYKEILRVPSPDNRVDAVLIQGNGGATTPFSYYLYVVPSGCPISEKDMAKKKYDTVFAADRMTGQTVTWVKN